jgi:glycosyltransferase involved in cell wall biosynthesis
MKVSVIIPVYNEAPTILQILKRVEAANIAEEIIVIDDGSTDGTSDILREAAKDKFKIVYKEKNKGKGNAIKEGLKLVTGDIVIIQDADLEYDPKDYPALIEPIVLGKASVVYGSRQGLEKIPFNLFKLGRWCVTVLTNILYGTNISDESCGYKVFKTDVIKGIPLVCKRFEFCAEITAKIARLNYKILEIPVSYSTRTVKEGKKLTYKDGLQTVITLIKYRIFK